MAAFRPWLVRFGLAPAFLVATLFAVGTSAAAVTGGPPFCEGFPCVDDHDCGSKCVCNSIMHVCLDNTLPE